MIAAWEWLSRPLVPLASVTISRLEAALLLEVTIGAALTAGALTVAQRRRATWLRSGENGIGTIWNTALVRRQAERLARLAVWAALTIFAATQPSPDAESTKVSVGISFLLLGAITTDCLGAMLDWWDERVMRHLRRSLPQKGGI